MLNRRKQEHSLENAFKRVSLSMTEGEGERYVKNEKERKVTEEVEGKNEEKNVSFLLPS